MLPPTSSRFARETRHLSSSSKARRERRLRGFGAAGTGLLGLAEGMRNQTNHPGFWTEDGDYQVILMARFRPLTSKDWCRTFSPPVCIFSVNLPAFRIRCDSRSFGSHTALNTLQWEIPMHRISAGVKMNPMEFLYISFSRLLKCPVQ